MYINVCSILSPNTSLHVFLVYYLDEYPVSLFIILDIHRASHVIVTSLVLLYTQSMDSQYYHQSPGHFLHYILLYSSYHYCQNYHLPIIIIIFILSLILSHYLALYWYLSMLVAPQSDWDFMATNNLFVVLEISTMSLIPESLIKAGLQLFLLLAWIMDKQYKATEALFMQHFFTRSCSCYICDLFTFFIIHLIVLMSLSIPHSCMYFIRAQIQTLSSSNSSLKSSNPLPSVSNQMQ